MNFDDVVRGRRSVRGFLPGRFVARELVMEVLELAQRTPSNCNVQPWRVYVASGATLKRLKAAWRAERESADTVRHSEAAVVQRFEGLYRERQIECAINLYEQIGVARDDGAGRKAALLRNFDCFDAPHVALLCMDCRFELPVALDMGAYLQTFLLALWSRGIASCAQVSLAQAQHVTRGVLGIPDELKILCGVSFGYEDPDAPANRVRQPRQDVADNVTFRD